MLKKYFGTWNSYRKSHDVGKLRCQIAQIPLYIQNISYTQTLSEIDPDSGRLHDDEYISQWSKGDDTFVPTRSLLLFPFLKLIQINIILSDNVHILYIYTCLNQTLNKPESCINLTLNQDSMQNIFVNLTCITEHMSLLNWKGGPNEVRFRQVSLKWTYLSLA